MSEKKSRLSSIKDKAANRLASIDKDAVKKNAKERALQASEVLGSKAADIKESAMSMKEDITEKQ